MARPTQLFREIILPAGLLSSIIVGAGMFALPYVFSQSGLPVGFFYLILFTAAVTVLHRMYTTIVLETKGDHRFVGHARIYLGDLGYWVSMFTTGLRMLLVLTVYIILAGRFLEVLFANLSGVGPYVLWVVGSLAIVLSLRRLEALEFIVLTAMGAIIIVLFGFGSYSGSSFSFTHYSLPALFLPYGVVLFSLGGRPGISTLAEYFKRNKLDTKQLYRAVSLGTVVPAIVYTLFIFAVLWLSPSGVSPDALSGLQGIFPPLLILVVALGILALWTSYFLLGLEIRDTIRFDLGFSKLASLGLVIGLPMFFYVVGFRNLIEVIGLVGGLFGALEGFMVIAMFSKLKKWSVIGVLLSIVFLVGALYELYTYIY